MFAALQIVTAPAIEPVTIEQARRHMRVDQTDDDDLIAGYISAARTWAESYLNRAMVKQQLAYTISRDLRPGGYPYLSMPLSLLVLPLWFTWPMTNANWLRMPLQPVISIDKVAYGAFGQDDTVLVEGTDYYVDTASARIQIQPYSQVLPNDHLQVTFTAGYDDDGASLPATFKIAILMLTAFLYENRGDANAEMPRAAEMLLTPMRLVGFGGNY